MKMDHIYYNKQTQKFKEIVEQTLNVNILDKTRRFENVFARSCYYYLCRTYTDLSYQKISNTVKKNHATVMHGLKELPYIIKHDKRCNRLFNKIVNQIEKKHFENKHKKTVDQLVRDYNYYLLKNNSMQNYIDKLEAKNKKLLKENKEMERVIYIMADVD